MIYSLDEESRLYYKLKDIRLLYDGFQDYLRERYITKEELLDVLSREVRESELLKNSTVVLDGFTGFTPVQNRLILELMKYCDNINQSGEGRTHCGRGTGLPVWISGKAF